MIMNNTKKQPEDKKIIIWMTKINIFFQLFKTLLLVIICETENPTQVSFKRKIKYSLNAQLILNFSIY